MNGKYMLTCVMCGTEVPEGRQVCPKCEKSEEAWEANYPTHEDIVGTKQGPKLINSVVDVFNSDETLNAIQKRINRGGTTHDKDNRLSPIERFYRKTERIY